MQERLRDVISDLRSSSYLNVIEQSDISSLPEIQFEYAKKEKALLIKEVIGYDFSYLTNLFSSRNYLADLLGCGVEEMHQRFINYKSNLIEPVEVQNSPFQDSRTLNKNPDLHDLPSIQFNKGDGGKYITAGIVFAKDPSNSQYQNASIHRLQVKDKDKLGIRMEPSSHLLKMQKEAEDKEEDLEVAIAIGNHPAELLASVTNLDYGVNELSLAGAIRGEPVETASCESIDVQVPTAAEIIIEGRIPHDIRETEGPFGDFQGFYTKPNPNHVVDVETITHSREKPIYQSIRASSLEDALLLGFSREVTIYRVLTNNGHKVNGVNLRPMVFNAVISIEKQEPEEAEEVIRKAIDAYPWLKYCIVVDADVDCYDLSEVWWAIATRSTPKELLLEEAGDKFSKDPFEVHNGEVGIDATKPLAHKEDFQKARP